MQNAEMQNSEFRQYLDSAFENLHDCTQLFAHALRGQSQLRGSANGVLEIDGVPVAPLRIAQAGDVDAFGCLGDLSEKVLVRRARRWGEILQRQRVVFVGRSQEASGRGTG